MLERIILPLVGSLMLATGLVVVRLAVAHREVSRRRVFTIAFPRDASSSAVLDFVTAHAGLWPPRWRRLIHLPAVVWEVEASAERVTFRIHIERGAVDLLLGQARACWPGIRIEEESGRAPVRPRLAAEMRLSNHRRTLAVERPDAVAAAMLASLRPLYDRERAVYQFVISPAWTPAPPNMRGGFLAMLLGDGKRKPVKLDAAEKEKLVGPHFVVSLRAGVAAKSKGRARQLLRSLLAPLHITRGSGISLRRRLIPTVVARHRVERRSVPVVGYRMFMTARELAALVAIPQGDLVLPGLTLGRARQLPVPGQLPLDEAPIARSNYPGSNRLLTFGVRSLPYHGWIVGGTGAGKSTALANVIRWYMEANATIVLLDAKRDLAQDVVDLIPQHRIEDLVLIDPADERPIGINVLSAAPHEAELVVDQLVGSLVRLFPGSVGPRSQDLLRTSFAVLTRMQGATLLEVPAMFLDETFRRKALTHIDDPIVLEPAWAAFNALSPGERAQVVAPPMNKLRSVLARRFLRDIVGQSKGLDLAAVLSKPTILVAALSKGLIGQDASSLLGSLLLIRVWQSLMSRVGIPKEQRRPVVIVLDEAQDYLETSVSLGEMLAQARSLNVGVLVCHQHVGQMPPPLRQDLRANARTKIAFQLSAPDAKLFAEEFSPYLDAADLQGLERFEIAAQICLDAQVLAPATGTTFPPPAPSGFGDRARELSRQRYGKPREEIEREIRRRHGERPGEGSVGTRRRS